MKTCSKCGKIMEDGAAICTGCGSTFTVQYDLKPAVVKPSGYILRYLINLIPFVGPIVYFIMLFIWSADTTKEESFRNWAKAQLWWMLIGVAAVFLLLIVFFFGLGFTLKDVIDELIYF